MRWLLTRFASLVGTIVAALAGAAASQTLGFIYAYQQRLGGHLDEARRMLDEVRSGAMAAPISEPAAHQQLLAELSHRVDGLRAAYDAIAGAGVFAKPAVFAAHLDYDIAAATMKAFTPTIPIDPASLVFAFLGLAIGWALWQAGEGAVAAMCGRRRAAGPRRLPSGRRPG